MENTSNGSTLRLSGGILLGLGALIVCIGFGMTTTAEYSSTLNIGLLNDQSNLIVVGALMAVCGAIFYGAGSIVLEMNRVGALHDISSETATVNSSDETRLGEV